MNKKRPLSPHLQIYRWQLPMLTSIMHRISGIIVSLSLVIIVLAFVILSHGMNHFLWVQGLVLSWVGRLFLLGLNFALAYHFCNGIRHLLWDCGWGFGLETAKKSAYMVFGATLILALGLCFFDWGVL